MPPPPLPFPALAFFPVVLVSLLPLPLIVDLPSDGESASTENEAVRGDAEDWLPPLFLRVGSALRELDAVVGEPSRLSSAVVVMAKGDR